MASKKGKKPRRWPFNAADVANIAKANPYIQRLIDDARAARKRAEGDRVRQERLRAGCRTARRRTGRSSRTRSCRRTCGGARGRP